MAFAAPLLVYNDEAVDAVESEVLPETYRAQLQSWWNITDRDSTLEIVRWLLHEGHHADADAALAFMRGGQSEAGDPEEKTEDVQAIAEFMIENGCCTAGTLPQTVIAWDLVRIANLGRWALHAGYLSEEEMWQVMQVDAASPWVAASGTATRRIARRPGRSSPHCSKRRPRPGGRFRGTHSNPSTPKRWNGDLNSM